VKRILRGGACFGMILLILLSCASCGTTSFPSPASTTTATSKPVHKLTMWYWNIMRPDLSTDLYRDIVNDWNDSRPDIQIETTALDIEEYRSKIKTSLAAGEAPDMFYMWSGSFVRPYLRTGNMLSLDAYLTDDIRARIKPGMLEKCMDEGKVYSLPIGTFIANLYCNTDLFKKADAGIPKTYEELVVAIKALRQEGITPIALGEKDRWPGMYWYDILAMRIAGAKGAQNALEYPALFEREVFRDAAEKLVALYSLGAFSKEAFEWGFVEMLDSFRKGEAAMMYQGNWVNEIIEAKDSPTLGKVTVVPFPIVTGGNGSAYEFLGGNLDSFYIRASTAYPKDAVEVLLHVSEQAARQGEAESSGISCWKSDPALLTNHTPLAAQSIALMETARSFLGWWDTLLPAVSADTHKSLVADLLDGRVTPIEFSAEMAKLNGMQP